MLNLPNLLSLARIVAAPAVMILVSLDSVASRRVAAAIFVLSALTDLLDGMLARRLGQVSLVGKFLDPLADKILVLGTLLMLLRLQELSAWLVFLIVGREIAISTLRTVAIGEGVVIAARNLGKQKTLFQMSGLVAAILGSSIPVAGLQIDLGLVGSVLLWIGALLGVASGLDYFLGFARSRADEGRGTG